MRKTILLIFISHLLISCRSNSRRETQNIKVSSNLEEKLVQWINHKVDSAVQRNDIPALSFAIIKNGSIIIKNGVGVLNRNTREPATENSIYQIASDTKKMTGIIAKNLDRENKLDLDKPIVHYLENLLNDKAKERLKNITLRYLLLHKSGLPYRQLTKTREGEEPMLIPYTEELLLNDLNAVELESEPGIKFSYSNFGYAVVGYICELVSRKTYANLIQQYVSKAYDMPNTSIILTDRQKKFLATPYYEHDRKKETSAFNMGELASAGGVYSTVSDLAKLMMLQIDAYANYGKQFNPLILHENLNEKKNGYGFGLGKKVFDSGIQYGHGGDLDGFGSAYVFSPEYKSGVILLTSSGGRWVGELEKELFAKLTNQEYKYIPPKKSIAQEAYNIISEKGFQEGKKWFEQNKNSEEYYLKQEEMDNVGKALLQQERQDDALEVFKYNVELFPKSGSVYNSLGEYYLKIGDEEFALRNFKKSIQLDPNNINAKENIEKLK